MKSELLIQFEHTWKMFYKMVDDFDDKSWLKIGSGYITPARISCHILSGVKYYIEDHTNVVFNSGNIFDGNWEKCEERELPNRIDIEKCIHEFKKKIEKWINDMKLEDENKAFAWTGKMKMSVVLFLLRHMEYHIGEINLLLHISKNGDANDNWIMGFENMDI